MMRRQSTWKALALLRKTLGPMGGKTQEMPALGQRFLCVPVRGPSARVNWALMPDRQNAHRPIWSGRRARPSVLPRVASAVVIMVVGLTPQTALRALAERERRAGLDSA